LRAYKQQFSENKLSVHFQTGDSDEGPALKKNHQEESTSDSKKTNLPAHNSIADTLLCSICQVWRKGYKTELLCTLLFNKSKPKMHPHFCDIPLKEW